MEAWFDHVVRQVMLYGLPVLISLTFVPYFEHAMQHQKQRFAMRFFWHGAWLPLAASLIFSRALIVALPMPVQHGIRAAGVRFFGHFILCVFGFLFYQWALAHPPLAGLPPLYHWWAKVLMYFNLCVLALHVLPLPTLWMGEWLYRRSCFASYWETICLQPKFGVWLLMLLAASPLLDIVLGGVLVFPAYEYLATLAE